MTMTSKIAKAASALALAAALALGAASPALAGEWQSTSGRWWYAHDGGGYAAAGWEKVGGTWYLFDGAGWMRTGWADLGGTWYYLEGSGAMAEGWRYVDGEWYYLNPGSGAMATGWKSVNGTWYYLDGSGAMAADRWVGDYWVGPSGAMATSSWVDGGRYYVGANGAWQPSAKPSSAQNPADVHEHVWTDMVEKKCVWIIDSPAVTTYEHDRAYICKTCGRSFTGNAALLCILQHTAADGPCWRPGNPTARYETRGLVEEVVTSPEKGHWETADCVVGRICADCGAEERL